MSTNEIRYTVHFRNSKGVEYMDESFSFYVSENTDLFGVLEEQLYIMNELTPLKSRQCRVELATHGITYFTYHRTEVFMVTYMWDGSHDIQVYECSSTVAEKV